MNANAGRPTLVDGQETVYLNLGRVALTPEQAEAFQRLLDEAESKAEVIRTLLEKELAA